MNIWAAIPLASSVAHAGLLIFVLRYTKRRTHSLFAVYLAVAAFWSFTSFMLHMSTTSQQAVLWNEILAIAMMWTLVAYYHFIRSYVNKPIGIGLYIGYAYVLAITVLSLTGLLVRSAYVTDGILYNDLGWALYLIGAGSLYFIGMVIFLLIKRYRSSQDPVDRNKTMYLVAGWVILVVFSYTNLIPAISGLSLDHIGNLCNALAISIAVLKLQLLDMRVILRRGLVYSILFISLVGVFVVILFLQLRFFPDWPVLVTVSLGAVVAVAMAILFRSLRYFLQEWVDRLFHRETYIYRQALLSFSAKVGNILDLGEIAGEMLSTIAKALRLTTARLLFQDAASGDFVTRFVYPQVKTDEDENISFNADNPVIVWLAKEGKPLHLETMATIPQLRALWTAEKEVLEASGLGLLYPIKSRGRLIAVLALGQKQAGNLYHPEEIELVATMANQASIVIENAQLYTEATIRANTDGLTDLNNHRNFHERIEQETARGARFGSPFSLIMVDIDLFKTYNDIYGHQAGDRILHKMAEYIKSSVRSIDIAFRYGGEEFAIILPETRLDDAYKVAERIRKTIETKMSSRAMPITVSVGVASWPSDGVTKEEVIASADAALYRAKQTGRNRTCLSSDAAKRSVSMEASDSIAEKGALSIIYALAATVDAKDHYTYGHSKKVSEYAVAAADAFGLPRERINTIRAAALLHDIGKIGVPDSILNKQGPLSESEWEPIKEHPQLGVEILRHVIDLINCLPAILHHHEHYDGTGYPFGLQGNNIPMEARLLAIADAYDAMTSLRPYRKRLLPQEALKELRRCSGTQFDPDMVEKFCTLMEPALPEELEIT